MFYLKNDLWTPYRKKVTHTITTVRYVDDPAEIPEGATAEDFVLTPDQRERLEVLKDRPYLTPSEVLDYVIYGRVPENLTPIIEEYKKLKAIDELITALPESVLKDNHGAVIDTASTWSGRDVYYRTGKPLTYEGVLYKVTEDHFSTMDLVPGMVEAPYKKFDE